MADTLKNCPVCGAEMAANAKSCPKCGAKNKKPIYKKWWFWVIIVFVVIGIIGSVGGSNGESEEAKKTEIASANTTTEAKEETITYTKYDVTDLFDALDDNALKAEKTFKGQYVEITGYLGTIDSSGKYIGVGAAEDDWDHLFSSVQCYIKSDKQLEQIMEMSNGDNITVRGKVTSVGEVLGYSLNIDSIN